MLYYIYVYIHVFGFWKTVLHPIRLRRWIKETREFEKIIKEHEDEYSSDMFYEYGKDDYEW